MEEQYIKQCIEVARVLTKYTKGISGINGISRTVVPFLTKCIVDEINRGFAGPHPNSLSGVWDNCLDIIYIGLKNPKMDSKGLTEILHMIKDSHSRDRAYSTPVYYKAENIVYKLYPLIYAKFIEMAPEYPPELEGAMSADPRRHM